LRPWGGAVGLVLCWLGLHWASPGLVPSSCVLLRLGGKRSHMWILVRVGEGRVFRWGMGWFAVLGHVVKRVMASLVKRPKHGLASTQDHGTRQGMGLFGKK